MSNAAEIINLKPDPETIWSRRASLSTLHDFARAYLASPWAVLAVTLARTTATVPPHITLPPLVGGRGSLNLFVAVVGASGLGKGAATAVSHSALALGQDIPMLPIGSGEGMAKAIGHREVVDVEGQPKYWITVIDNPSVIFEASEVDQFAAQGGRSGSTLFSQIRSAWSGEVIGATYATAEKAVTIPAHDYRCCFIVGVQPRRSGALLHESDGGTPQRFLWLPAADPLARDGVKIPEQMMLPKIDWPLNPMHMEVPKEAARAIRQNRIKALKGASDVLDGHMMLTRLKTAAALAVLDGRTDVDSEDWDISELIMQKSADTRDLCVQELRAVETEAAARRGEDRAHADAAHESKRAELKLRPATRVAINISERLADGETWTRGALNRKQTSADRKYVDEALAILVREERAVKVSDTEYRGHGDPMTAWDFV